MRAIDSVLHLIHEWNQPEHHSMKRIFMTRAAGLFCATLEAISLISASILLGIQTAKYVVQLVFPQIFCRIDDQRPHLNDLWMSCLMISKIFVGMVSSLLFGVVVSPEISDRIHQKMDRIQLLV